MKMIAKVRMTEEVEFDHDAVEPTHDDHPRSKFGAPGQVMTNEDDVLASRRAAATEAERAARERYPDAAEIIVEEVREA